MFELVRLVVFLVDTISLLVSLAVIPCFLILFILSIPFSSPFSSYCSAGILQEFCKIIKMLRRGGLPKGVYVPERTE
jgi:hypothetical protein